jgi:ABC-type sugar transport system ATPase subunit
MSREEAGQLRSYLNRLSEKGIRIICFSKSLDDLQSDCAGIITTRNGRSAKFTTF